MGIFSEPGKELVGGGDNAKYVKECTELYLGNRGIEKLRGFEPFVNLSSLWLNNNRIKKINNLDANFRIKALYAQDNQICTLRGSLLCFTFLETLDLSNNQLRDLDKQLLVLEKCKFLQCLNLTGNPCVEEPDYRLTMVHRMPQLHVLDQHVITDAERRKAAAVIGGDVQALTVAFMQRVPQYNPAWDAKVPERSVLEQELVKEAATIRDIKASKAYDAEIALFKHNPYPDIPRSRTLPPNAGTRRAQMMNAQDGAPRTRGGLAKMGGFKPPPLLFHHEDEPDLSDRKHMSVFAHRQSMKSTATAAFSQCNTEYPFEPPKHSFKHGHGTHAEVASHYVPKDIFSLHSCTPGISELQASGTRLVTMYGAGPLQFEQGKYEAFVKQRACGRERWGLAHKEVLL